MNDNPTTSMTTESLVDIKKGFPLFLITIVLRCGILVIINEDGSAQLGISPLFLLLHRINYLSQSCVQMPQTVSGLSPMLPNMPSQKTHRYTW